MTETKLNQQIEQPFETQSFAQEDAVFASAQQVRKRRRLWIGVAVVTLLVMGFFAARYFVWASAHEETDDAYLQGHIHAVSSRINGTVAQVLVDDNQPVQAGQLLVALDPQDFQVRVDQAHAALDVAMRQADTAEKSVSSTAETATAQRTEAQGTIGESLAGISSAKAGLIAAKAGVPKAEAELARAQATQHRQELELARYKDLLGREQVSHQTVERVQEAYQVSIADVAAQQQAVSQAQAQAVTAEQAIASAQAALQHSQGLLQSANASRIDIGVRDAQFSTAKSSISQAAAALEEAKLQLSYTRNVAPVSGRIARKSVESGQRLQAGQPLLAVVEDQPWIVANFKETQLEKMRPQQPVEIRVDSFRHHTFHGHVESLAPGSGNEFALLPPDNATGNFTKIVQRIPVKIVFDDSTNEFQGLLMPGTSAVVTVNTKERN